MPTNEPVYGAGVDEAGRGPLAGPVVCAAVILDPARPIEGLRDSKQLSEKQREKLYPQIQSNALSWAIACVEVEDIYKLNILQATLLGMQRAVMQLSVVPSVVWVDGNQKPQLPYLTQTIVRGDQLIPAISAASILAKVYRDTIMQDLDTLYPGYGFSQNKGYPTRGHIAAIRSLGVTPSHRMGFAPIKDWFE